MQIQYYVDISRIQAGPDYLAALSVAQALFGLAGFARYDPSTGKFGVGFIDLASGTFVWKGSADCWEDAAQAAVEAQARIRNGEIKELH